MHTYIQTLNKGILTHQGPRNKNMEDANVLNNDFLKDCANFKASSPLPPSTPMLR